MKGNMNKYQEALNRLIRNKYNSNRSMIFVQGKGWHEKANLTKKGREYKKADISLIQELITEKETDEKGWVIGG